jgi:hypothetical protein
MTAYALVPFSHFIMRSPSKESRRGAATPEPGTRHHQHADAQTWKVPNAVLKKPMANNIRCDRLSKLNADVRPTRAGKVLSDPFRLTRC